MSAATQSTSGCGTVRPSAATLALKRLLDVAGSSLGLITLWPLFIIIAVAIKLETPGLVFFRQERVGRGGKLFHILKFRSMVCDAPQIGRVITIRSDSRITRVGSFIRKIKLDEFPQLINVLIGHMSLVGPRPEVPELMTLYTQEQQALILSFRPGMTDYASILFRHESYLLDGRDDPVEVSTRDYADPSSRIMSATAAMSASSTMFESSARQLRC
jgi:lipopolysaccharide/colanic/teichoic acid biosynthesis glycosyltransferase